MNRTTILVVEDDQDHRNLIRLVLVRGVDNVHVDTVVSVDEAFAYLEGGPAPDLIVLDLWLDGVSGLGVLEWLAARGKIADIPTILFTSSEDPEHAKTAYSLGARRYLIKPADFNVLVGVIREELSRWSEPEAESAS